MSVTVDNLIRIFGIGGFRMKREIDGIDDISRAIIEPLKRDSDRCYVCAHKSV